MIVDLISTIAEDGLRLDGALHAPAATQRAGATPTDATSAADSLPADAFVFLHGVGGNFYASSLFAALTPPLIDRGAAVLWANTRGHDGLHTAWIRGRRRQFGAAFEIVDQCRLDLAAWIELLRERGFRRIGLLGHSLGAIKAIYSQAHQPHEAVACIVAASPPRLSYNVFKDGARREDFHDAMNRARQHVEQGSGEALIDVRFPFPLVISAATFVDKYGPQEHYNILKFAPRVACPLLFAYGSFELAEGGEAFAGLPEALLAARRPDQKLDVATIEGANHNYSGRYAQLADAVLHWLDALGTAERRPV